MPYSSNATYLVHVVRAGRSHPAIYKPVRGERPLWDFPDGTLAGREVASYLISEQLGWGVIPETVLRDGRFAYTDFALAAAAVGHCIDDPPTPIPA